MGRRAGATHFLIPPKGGRNRGRFPTGRGAQPAVTLQPRGFGPGCRFRRPHQGLSARFRMFPRGLRKLCSAPGAQFWGSRRSPSPPHVLVIVLIPAARACLRGVFSRLVGSSQRVRRLRRCCCGCVFGGFRCSCLFVFLIQVQGL